MLTSRFAFAIFLLLPLTCTADDIYYTINNKIYKSTAIAVSVPVPSTFIPIELEAFRWSKFIVIKSADNDVRRIAFDDIVSLHVAPLTLDDFSKIVINDGTIFLRTGESKAIKAFSTEDDFPNAVQVTAFPLASKICTLSIPSPRAFAGAECTVINTKNPSDTQSFRINYISADMITAMSWINPGKVLCVTNAPRGNGAFVIDVLNKSNSARLIDGDYFMVENGKLIALKKSDSGPYQAKSINP